MPGDSLLAMFPFDIPPGDAQTCGLPVNMSGDIPAMPLPGNIPAGKTTSW